MCRLFGLHSQHPVGSDYLLDAHTGFARLSKVHKDGWGLAYYRDQQACLTRALTRADQDPAFVELGQGLKTNTLIAHLRLATIGENKLDNNHPFQYQDWIFAHNGNIKHFDRYRQLILSQINPHFRAWIQGDTDSELIFYFLLTELERWGLVSRQYRHSTSQLGETIKWALENLLSLIGPFANQSGPPSETYMSFLMTNGQVMLAHQGGQPLYYQSTPQAGSSKLLEQIVFCSEPLDQPESWQAMQAGELIAVDQSFQLYPIRGY